MDGRCVGLDCWGLGKDKKAWETPLTAYDQICNFDKHFTYRVIHFRYNTERTFKVTTEYVTGLQRYFLNPTPKLATPVHGETVCSPSENQGASLTIARCRTLEEKRP